MRRLFLVLSLLIGLTCYAAPEAANGAQGSNGINKTRKLLLRDATKGQMLFDPLTVVSLDGQISSVKAVQPHHLKHMGVHVNFQSNGKNYEVPVGPEWYMEKIGLNLRQNEKIHLQGSIINRNGLNVLVPTKITAEGKTFILRDSNGIPAWMGESKLDRKL